MKKTGYGSYFENWVMSEWELLPKRNETRFSKF